MGFPYDKAHLDGFRPVRSENEHGLIIEIHLWAEGRPVDKSVFAPFEFSRTGKDRPEADERYMILATAICTFLNSGGDKYDLFLRTDSTVNQIPELSIDLKLVSVLPHMPGHTFIWKLEGGDYLRVEDGDEGFSERLTEEQLKAHYRDVLDEYGPEAA